MDESQNNDERVKETEHSHPLPKKDKSIYCMVPFIYNSRNINSSIAT